MHLWDIGFKGIPIWVDNDISKRKKVRESVAIGIGRVKVGIDIYVRGLLYNVYRYVIHVYYVRLY